jgi:hypothetical protein
VSLSLLSAVMNMYGDGYVVDLKELPESYLYHVPCEVGFAVVTLVWVADVRLS